MNSIQEKRDAALKAGSWWPCSADEFVAAVEKKVADDPYRVEYETLVIPALKAFFQMHEAVADGNQR